MDTEGGWHQAFSIGPPGSGSRGREELKTHNVIGMTSHMLVAAKFVQRGATSWGAPALKIKAKMSALTKRNSDRQMSGAHNGHQGCLCVLLLAVCISGWTVGNSDLQLQ